MVGHISCIILSEISSTPLDFDDKFTITFRKSASLTSIKSNLSSVKSERVRGDDVLKIVFIRLRGKFELLTEA